LLCNPFLKITVKKKKAESIKEESETDEVENKPYDPKNKSKRLYKDRKAAYKIRK